jgi:23S rRNA pseudouridine2605 synthase
LTSEQLQNARAARWRQAGNPLLTAEEARSWMEGVGLCLFAPRRAHFAAPAPSLVEAVAGTVTDGPSRETVETATTLLKRLAADAAVIPLNLFGGAGAPGAGFGAASVAGAAGLGSFDTPDFVMAREVLPYVFSLIGGRNWKSGPGDKASPLMVEVWTLLDGKRGLGDGAMTAAEVQRSLGREVTETAVLRALGELWHGLRVVPVYDAEETRWEVTHARFAAEMTVSQKVAQTTSLSALVSLYLDGVVGAEREEIEVFLSPLAARSRVREVINGMQATRQLEIVSVGAHPLLHVSGSLPEFAEEPTAEMPDAAERPAKKAVAAEERPKPRFEKREREGGFERRDRGDRKPFREGRAVRGERRPFEKKRFEKKPFERGERKPFERGEKRPYSRPQDGDRKPFGARSSGGARPFDKERGGERRSFGGGGKFPPKRFGAGPARPWKDRGGEREGGREGERSAGREGGEKRPFEKKQFEKKPFEPGARKPFGGPKKFGAAKKFGEGKPGTGKSYGRGAATGGFERGKPAGKRPFFRERPDGERTNRERPDRGRPDRERRVKDGEGAPRRRELNAEKREGTRPQKREGGWKPKGAGFATGGKPGFKSVGKPGFKKMGKTFGKPAFGKQGKPFGGGKPGLKKTKPGGFKSPFRKKKEGSGDGE